MHMRGITTERKRAETIGGHEDIADRVKLRHPALIRDMYAMLHGVYSRVSLG